MTVTSVDLKNWSGTVTRGAERTYQLVYRVTTDSADDGPETVRDAQGQGIPMYQTSYSFGNEADAGAFLIGYEASLVDADETYKYWEVTCNFSSEVSENDDSELWDNPLSRPTKWSGSFVQFSRDFHFDKDATAIKNSAGDPLSPSVQGDDSHISIIAEKNFAALDIVTWASFRDAVNSNTQWGLSARKLKVQGISWNQQFSAGIPYYAVRFEFHINDATWDVSVLDAGYYERESGKNKRIPEKLGRDINTPKPLNSSGVALTEAQIDSDSENTLTFKIYNEKNFALLGLPAAIGLP